VTSKLNIVLFCAIYLISVLPSLLSCFSSGNISLPEVPAKRKIQTSHCRSPSVRQRSVSPSMRHRSRTRERQNRNRSLSRESSSQRPSTSYASETRRRAPESHKRNAEFPMTEERKFFLLCWKNAYTFQEKSNIFFASLLLNQFANSYYFWILICIIIFFFLATFACD
jgi:hypothetical protein